MDAYDIITHVSEYCARQDRFTWFMAGWYLFSDTRPGDPVERWIQDRETFQLLRGGV